MDSAKTYAWHRISTQYVSFYGDDDDNDDDGLILLKSFNGSPDFSR